MTYGKAASKACTLQTDCHGMSVQPTVRLADFLDVQQKQWTSKKNGGWQKWTECKLKYETSEWNLEPQFFDRVRNISSFAPALRLHFFFCCRVFVVNNLYSLFFFFFFWEADCYLLSPPPLDLRSNIYTLSASVARFISHTWKIRKNRGGWGGGGGRCGTWGIKAKPIFTLEQPEAAQLSLNLNLMLSST